MPRHPLRPHDSWWLNAASKDACGAGHSSERTNRCAGEHLLAGVREIVYRRSIPLATQHLAIVQSRAGATAGVLGAAIMVTQQILAPAAVDARAGRGAARGVSDSVTAS